jgi:peptidoglycan/xylan/chitin deacetylase (PgdA/CDA1 family)
MRLAARTRGLLLGTFAVAAFAVATVVLTPASGATQSVKSLARTDPVDVSGSPLDLTSVAFGQLRDRLVLKFTTTGTWSADQLVIGSGRAVCVKLFYGALASPRARICVVARGGATRLRYTELDQTGQPMRVRPLAAVISRPSARSLEATLTPAGAHLPTGRYSWQAESDWTDSAACAPPAACTDHVPDSGTVGARITTPRVVVPTGCVPRGPTQRNSGPPGSHEVALTFDDGPSPATGEIVRELEHEHAPATFFMVGNEVPGHRTLLQRMLRDGFMIGNHTLTHAYVAGAGPHAVHQISSTQAIIRAASGFTPCLFRPPDGATSQALNAAVRSLDMLSILWNVDPQDWRTPGTPAIVSNVLRQTHAGSIILLHDGGGPRDQTLAALPTIIHSLTARGLRFVTITQLLHLRTTRP